jgi:hypothetical protein
MKIVQVLKYSYLKFFKFKKCSDSKNCLDLKNIHNYGKFRFWKNVQILTKKSNYYFYF